MFLLIAVLIPMLTGALLPLWRFEKRGMRAFYVLTAEALALAAAILGFFEEGDFLLARLGSVTLMLGADKLGGFFAVLIFAAWVLTSIYTVRYIAHEGGDDRFFAFLLLTLGGLLGVCFARNMVTLYLFFEAATLCSMPTVLHEQTVESVAAALKYLFYSIGGAFLGLLGIFAVYHYAEDPAFTLGGSLTAEALGDGKKLFLVMIFLAVVGFATKAGMFPMHAWLPTAHPVAPAPASALLSGVITKAGVIAVIRLVYYTVGTELLAGTWVQYAWIVLALITVFMGSMMAYHEKLLKKRLAYSTVSNLSYILVGLFTLCPEGMVGALLHVTAHASAKTALFMAAGAIILQTGKTRTDELSGVGKAMPVTLWSFTFAALSLIGIPPFGGFISKWHLASAALSSQPGAWGVVIPVVLLISALLTAGYLLPIVIHGFFPGADAKELSVKEAPASMAAPILILACVTLAAGLFASPLTAFFAGLAAL